MEATIYAGLNKNATAEDVSSCLSEFYADSPFVRLYDHGTAADTANVRGTNFCDIGFVLEKNKNRVILMSVIDNLVKGAAGQAVQNMNIMLGLDETAGFSAIPYPV
jgi:N-acetyl-gamma-glutamyl-phosphate reductase